MKFERSSGVLLHPTSLPGSFGIGDLGPQAYRWIDFLNRSGCGLWQVLPLGPTGFGDSPYQSFSAFAGNPYLISPELLLQDGLLHSNDLLGMPEFPPGKVDFGKLIPWKVGLLDRAFIQFQQASARKILADFDQFKNEHEYWLGDFCLFMALKEAHGGGSWVNWPRELLSRDPGAIQTAREKHQVAIQRQEFRQYIFHRQWSALREHAQENNILIIGDVPIFVAHDSAEVWARPELFSLDRDGNPKVVAGVPPDYFSKTGQLWGNPLYRWDVHQVEGYNWWLKRLSAILELVDIVRLDHFRGFAGYWEVPYGEKTAVKGRWVDGPGEDFFRAVQQELGDLPILAEDLGVITPDVVALRENFDLPGMRIIQFAFTGDPQEPFLPHNHVKHGVVYTGTHDNDTVRGWYERVPEREKSFYRRYLNRDGKQVAWDMIRAAWGSVAVYALAPMQDFLDLGNEARMNYPGNPSGNWTWRMSDTAMNERLEFAIREINFLYDRDNTPPDDHQDQPGE
jgi:4-alpha-glucanotransferase